MAELSGSDVEGTNEADKILGTSGDDILKGRGKGDLIVGESGNDFIKGHAGRDTLLGGAGDDIIYGGFGADRLQGGRGDDFLYGGRGNDFIGGDFGFDTLHGGGGNDTFFFSHRNAGRDGNGGRAHDIILDYQVGKDIIQTSFGNGLYMIQDGDDVLVYNSHRTGEMLVAVVVDTQMTDIIIDVV